VAALNQDLRTFRIVSFDPLAKHYSTHYTPKPLGALFDATPPWMASPSPAAPKKKVIAPIFQKKDQTAGRSTRSRAINALNRTRMP